MLWPNLPNFCRSFRRKPESHKKVLELTAPDHAFRRDERSKNIFSVFDLSQDALMKRFRHSRACPIAIHSPCDLWDRHRELALPKLSMPQKADRPSEGKERAERIGPSVLILNFARFWIDDLML